MTPAYWTALGVIVFAQIAYIVFGTYMRSWKDKERDAMIAADTIEALTDLLAQAIDLLNDARSGYISGSGPDTAWDARKEGFLKDCAALTAGAGD